MFNIYSKIHGVYTETVVKAGRERAGTEFLDDPGPHKIVTLRSWSPNLLSSFRDFGLWLPELCSKVLNPETLLATDLVQSH